MNIIEAMKIMDLEPGFSQSELHARWRELARMYHPDLNGCPEAKQRFILAQQAYDLLNSRFFSISRGANQDCLDQISREACMDQKKHPYYQGASANRRREAVSFYQRRTGNCWKVNRLLLALLIILFVVYLALRSSWIHQEIYELQINIACISSMLGAILASIGSLFKARVLVR